MTDIYYPHDYIPGPTYDNYGFEPTDPMIRTDRVGGLPGSVENIHQCRLIIRLSGSLKLMRKHRHLKHGTGMY
jgi:hypothetical protein